MKALHSRRARFCLVLAFLAVMLGNLGRYLVLDGLYLWDTRLRWQECAYVLHGLDPFAVMRGETPALPAVGAVDAATGGTVPWAYVLGNLMNPGFLPFAAVRVWILALDLLFALAAAWGLRGYLLRSGHCDDPAVAALAGALVLAPSMWANAVLFGNQSGIVCCCLVLVLCCLDRHPVLAGVLLAFAMCKPQIAFVFFLPLFCRRRWQPIAVAGALVLGAWGAASLATGTAPLTMLWDMLNQGLGYTSSYFGLFNFLLGFGAPTWLVLGLDIVAGMAVFAAGAALLRRRGLWQDWLAWFALAAVVSVLWFYKQNHDYIILLLPAVAIFCRRALRPVDLAAMTICLINVISYGLPWLFVLLGGRRGAAMPWGRLVEAIALVAALHRVMAALCEEDGLPAKPVPQGRRLRPNKKPLPTKKGFPP